MTDARARTLPKTVRAANVVLPLTGLHRWVIAAALVVMPSSLAYGQIINREYELKATLVQRLAAYVEPEGGRGDRAIKILVVGRRPAELKAAQAGLLQLGRRQVAWDPVVPPKPNSPENLTEVPAEGTWDIIYLLKDTPEAIDARLDALQNDERFRNQPTLIITEQTDSFRKTAAVNLFVDQAANQLRVQVRKSQLAEHQLKARDALYKTPGILVYD